MEAAMYYNENNVWLYSKLLDQENHVISRENNLGTNLINNNSDSENNDVDIDDANEGIIFDDHNPSQQNDNSHHNQDYNQYHDNNHISYRRPSARSMSSSLPIQIPARQMSKNLSKLKLEAILKGVELKSKCTPTTKKSNNANVLDLNNTSTTTTNLSGVTEKQYGLQGTQWVPASGELDEFFEQEFNDNHHSHYRVENDDHEQLRADENPMELFHSIQALARSVHEDAELFGSLPPKRMLESPIRTLVQLHD